MVARLLYLEDAERQRGNELDDELKYAHNQSASSSRYPSRQKELNSEMDPGRMSVSGGNTVDDMQSVGRGQLLFPTNDHVLQPDFNNSEGKNESILPSSKWAREDDESDEERDNNTRDLGLTYSSSGSENAGEVLYKAEELELTTDASNSTHLDGGMSEEQRQKLRRLEVALMEYRESLEERGIKFPEEIERKVASLRSRLQAEYGLFDSKTDASSRKKKDLRDDSKKRGRSRSRSESPQRKSSSRDRAMENERLRE